MKACEKGSKGRPRKAKSSSMQKALQTIGWHTLNTNPHGGGDPETRVLHKLESGVYHELETRSASRVRH